MNEWELPYNQSQLCQPSRKNPTYHVCLKISLDSGWSVIYIRQ